MTTPMQRSRTTREVKAALLFCIVVTAVGVPTSVVGQSLLPENLGVYIDQDIFFPPAFDQDYTMGVQFEYIGRDWGQTWVKRADWLMGVLPAILHGRWEDTNSAQAFLWGNSAFAPAKGVDGANLERSDPIFNDRPYASLLYLRAQRWSAGENDAFTSELTVGVLGLDVAKGVQMFIHEHISNDVRPGGWGNQISDGGELTGNYRASYRRRLFEVGWGDPTEGLPFSIDAVASLDGSIGYYTNVGSGARVRVGWWGQESYWWMWERMPIPAVLSDSGFIGDGALQSDAAPAPFGVCWGCVKEALIPDEFYLHVSGGATHWRNNVLLQGQFRRSAVELDFNDPRTDAAVLNRGLYDAQIGATASWGRFGASYAVVFQSAVFGGPNERTHSWGGLHFVFRAAEF